ncbi:hypothetical protein NPIL_564121 [Nephila pilipes]|uniref:Uncharacterized protein n=1 Tax=Nephila pilipes TaxID=299642 RepID=A0A8X6PMF5_NEPPI|nr:hypothetical protein NPIL_564121 [Nephila pilipes]
MILNTCSEPPARRPCGGCGASPIFNSIDDYCNECKHGDGESGLRSGARWPTGLLRAMRCEGPWARKGSHGTLTRRGGWAPSASFSTVYFELFFSVGSL